MGRCKVSRAGASSDPGAVLKALLEARDAVLEIRFHICQMGEAAGVPVTAIVTTNLNKIIDVNYYPVETAKSYTEVVDFFKSYKFGALAVTECDKLVYRTWICKCSIDFIGSNKCPNLISATYTMSESEVLAFGLMFDIAFHVGVQPNAYINTMLVPRDGQIPVDAQCLATHGIFHVVPVIAVATGPMLRSTVRRWLRKILATLYFKEITLSFCIRDPQLGKSIDTATALEVRATGIPYVFAPRIAGFVILDWQGIDRITSLPHSNYTYSVLAGIQAGIDMVMVPLNHTEFIDDLTYLVKNKFIPMSRIDDIVRRILRVKFTMGLFENPLADLKQVDELESQVNYSIYPFSNADVPKLQIGLFIFEFGHPIYIYIYTHTH
ncbi:hypothetical protein HHK36_022185 [Tetracentron sinense]|uniref:beta-glucosidase n=1 Tax=Tetracentron sinense TaxID=13715 RepID=A0A835D8K5_TETSI|nr:hypothetical protein HHK36_022185 [Tetracentron sinense]